MVLVDVFGVGFLFHALLEGNAHAEGVPVEQPFWQHILADISGVCWIETETFLVIGHHHSGAGELHVGRGLVLAFDALVVGGDYGEAYRVVGLPLVVELTDGAYA